MTASTLEPGTAITAAIRELLDAVRQLVEPDTDDPSVVDELSKIVSRARRVINKAKKASAPQPAPTPTGTPSTLVVPAPQQPPSASIPAAVPAVAVTEPARSAAVQPAALARREVTVSIPVPSGPAGPPRHRRPRRKRRRLPWWVSVIVLVLMIGGPALSVLTGNLLYGLGGSIGGLVVGHVFDRARRRNITGSRGEAGR